MLFVLISINKQPTRENTTTTVMEEKETQEFLDTELGVEAPPISNFYYVCKTIIINSKVIGGIEQNKSLVVRVA